RGGPGRPGRRVAAPGHVLVPVPRRRGAAARPGPAGVRGVVGFVVHVGHAAAESRPGGDGRAVTWQRAGVPARRHDGVRCGPLPGRAPRRRRRTAGAGRSGRTMTETLDCRGQRCPLPVIALARRLPELPVGAVLRVLADDPAAGVDIPAWCRMRGQEYVGEVPDGYEVRRLV